MNKKLVFLNVRKHLSSSDFVSTKVGRQSNAFNFELVRLSVGFQFHLSREHHNNLKKKSPTMF